MPFPVLLLLIGIHFTDPHRFHLILQTYFRAKHQDNRCDVLRLSLVMINAI